MVCCAGVEGRGLRGDWVGCVGAGRKGLWMVGQVMWHGDVCESDARCAVVVCSGDPGQTMGWRLI